MVTGIDAISVWYNAGQVLQRLRSVMNHRDTEINFLIDEMERDNDAKVLTPVMFLVFIRLANAAETGTERISNDPICMAILKIHGNDKLFLKLMEMFFRNKTGNDGKKVVITPSDPMKQEMTLDDMDDISKGEVQAYVNKVMEKTQGLKMYFKDWNEWEKLWESICMDVELLNLLKKKSPRTEACNMNMKMVCNVVGMYAGAKLKDVATTSLNDAFRENNMRSYINNHCAYNTPDTALSKEQHERIMKMMQ